MVLVYSGGIGLTLSPLTGCWVTCLIVHYFVCSFIDTLYILPYPSKCFKLSPSSLRCFGCCLRK